MAKFLLDENVDARLSVFLRGLGHDVQAIGVDYPNAPSDVEVLSIALHEQRIVLTSDQDFGELVIRDGLPHAGVMLLRLRSQQLAYVQTRIQVALSDNEDRLNDFLVVTGQTVRPHRGQAL
jgi:predicted nuclease of predicted toxin-antitoxin system